MFLLKIAKKIEDFIKTPTWTFVSLCIISTCIIFFIDRPFVIDALYKGNINIFSNAPYIFISFLIFAAFWYTCLHLARLYSIFAFVILPIILIIQFTLNYGASRYGTETEELSIAIINTTWHEALNYVNLRSSILFCFFFILLIFGSYLFRRLFTITASNTSKFIQFVTSVSILTIIFYTPDFIRNYLPDIAKTSVSPVIEKHPHLLSFPVRRTKEEVALSLIQDNTGNNSYFKSYQPLRNTELFFKAIVSFYFPTTLINSSTFHSAKNWDSSPETVVLYIGESFRADHSPLNGYHRNTLPLISSESNIINLPNLYSDETHTIASIYSILTASNKATGEVYSSFIDIFNKHNYNSILLVGKITDGYWYNTPLIAPVIRNAAPLYARPGSPAEYAESICAIKRNYQTPIFLLIQDGTGHQPYQSTTSKFGIKTNIDKYDNSILDVDASVHSVIATLKSSEAIMIFVSDHGESFGEGGRQAHAGPRTAIEQIHVCAFIWFSDKYNKNHPEIIQALRNNAHKFTSFEHIYHTIISMGGIASDIQVPELDMTIAPSDGSDN